jgi:GntR family transcriptional regulator
MSPERKVPLHVVGEGACVLDRHSPLPLWAQLAADLRRRLARAEFGSKFPTDAQLMVDYDVSRQTVREAVRRLVAEGCLDRQRGRGTEVRRPEFEQPMGSLYSLFRVIEAQGVTQTSVVRALEERVEPPMAARLDLAGDAPLIYLDRLRLAGGRPLALDQVWLPADLARPIMEADFHHTALYDELAKRCGVGPESGREQVRPVVPSPSERRELGLARGEAVLAIERLTWVGDRPLELRHSLVRGDRYGLVAEWEAPARALGEPMTLRFSTLATADAG